MTHAYRTQIDAVVALLRGVVGEPASARDRSALEQANPGQLIGIASAHAVLPLLAHGIRDTQRAGALPRDVRLFLDEMNARNAARNAAMREQLAELGRGLASAGFSGVALKGGADLLDPVYPSGGRFATDLDVLVAPEHLERARAVCAELGYGPVEGPDPAPGDPEESYHHERHLAPLFHPQRTAVLEIHRRVYDGKGDAALPSSLVWNTALPCGLPGLLVPCLAVRLLHLLVHAHAGAMPAGGLTKLRDVIELDLLGRRLDADGWALVRTRCADHGLEPALDGSIAVHRTLMRHDHLPQTAAGASIDAWVARAVDNLLSPGKLRRRELWAILANYKQRFLSSREVRRLYLRRLLQPGYLLKVLRLKLEVLRNYR